MSFLIALVQIQLTPQYHESYMKPSHKPRALAGRPQSPLRTERKQKMLAIVRDIGESQVAPILAIMRQTDPRLHQDDARKMLYELCEDKLMEKRTVYSGGKKVFYSVRQA